MSERKKWEYERDAAWLGNALFRVFFLRSSDAKGKKRALFYDEATVREIVNKLNLWPELVIAADVVCLESERFDRPSDEALRRLWGKVAKAREIEQPAEVEDDGDLSEARASMWLKDAIKWQARAEVAEAKLKEIAEKATL